MRNLIFMAMLLAALAPATFAAKKAKTPQAARTTISVVVVSVAADDSSFVTVDRDGKISTVTVDPSISVMMGRKPSSFDLVLRPGMIISETLNPGGTAAAISGIKMVGILTNNEIKAFMGLSDDDWSIVLPRIENVEKLKRIYEGREADSGATDNLNAAGDGNGNNAGASGDSPPDAAAIVPTTLPALAIIPSTMPDEAIASTTLPDVAMDPTTAPDLAAAATTEPVGPAMATTVADIESPMESTASGADLGLLSRNLQSLSLDTSSSPLARSEALRELRAGRAKAGENLAAARKDLARILDSRQIALLVSLGILE